MPLRGPGLQDVTRDFHGEATFMVKLEEQDVEDYYT
jgi:hypothetical protein